DEDADGLVLFAHLLADERGEAVLGKFGHGEVHVAPSESAGAAGSPAEVSLNHALPAVSIATRNDGCGQRPSPARWSRMTRTRSGPKRSTRDSPRPHTFS